MCCSELATQEHFPYGGMKDTINLEFDRPTVQVSHPGPAEQTVFQGLKGTETYTLSQLRHTPSLQMCYLFKRVNSEQHYNWLLID